MGHGPVTLSPSMAQGGRSGGMTEPVLDPEGSTACLNQRPRPTVCHVVTTCGMPYCDRTRHAGTWRVSQIGSGSRRERGCHKQHLSLNQATELSALTFCRFHTEMTVRLLDMTLKHKQESHACLLHFLGTPVSASALSIEPPFRGWKKKKSTA